MAKIPPDVIMKGLIDRGFRPHEAAGIVGNIDQESGFDTGAREINPQTESARKQGGGFGLFQWTSPERKQGLYNMAQMRGTTVDDPDLQLDYFTHEMQTSHKKALKALEATKDPRHAAYVVSKYYEIPSEKYANNSRRMGTAEKFFNMLNPIGTAQAEEAIDPAEFDAWEKSQAATSGLSIDPAEFDAWEKSQEPRIGQQIAQGITDIGGGVLKGASNIGNTILSAADSYNELLGNENALSSLDSTGEQRREAVTQGLKGQGVNTDSVLYNTGELGTEIAGTMGAGGLLAKGAKAVPVLSKLSGPIATAGIKGGNLVEKAIGGGISGAASTGLVSGDTKDAGTGALIGMALPPILAGAGKVGTGAGKIIKGASASGETKRIAKKALEKGLVIPPTQVKSSLANRIMEGTAGKITTAQNASAKNQEIFNAMAKSEIGAESLTEEGLAMVRSKANKAYDNIAKFGKIEADDSFKKAIDTAAARSEKFKADFPGLKNSDVDSLIESLKSKGTFSSDTTIEAIKRLRQEGAANKISLDATKKELGRFQSKVASSLEDLVDRNLEKAGKKELLTEYRNARQILAKTHSIEKATDKATGNITAATLANELKKGKPLTGALKDIAEFAQAFPKAAQNISKMGSLPQTSPLDVASVSTLSMMAGHPGYMALLAVRPAARKAVLSKLVQKRLTTGGAKKAIGGKMGELLNQSVKASPVLVTQGNK